MTRDNQSPAPQLVAVWLARRRGWLLSRADTPVAPRTLHDAQAIAAMAALFEAGVSCAEEDEALREACAAQSVPLSEIAHDGPFGEPWRVVQQPPSVRVFDREGLLVCDVYGGEAAPAVAEMIVAAVNGQAHIPTPVLEGRAPLPWRERPRPQFTPWRVGTGRGHFETIFGTDAPSTGQVASTTDRGPSPNHPAGRLARRIVACVNAYGQTEVLRPLAVLQEA